MRFLPSILFFFYFLYFKFGAGSKPSPPPKKFNWVTPKNSFYTQAYSSFQSHHLVLYNLSKYSEQVGRYLQFETIYGDIKYL